MGESIQFDLYFNYQQWIDVRECCDEPQTKQSSVVPLCHALVPCCATLR